MKTKLALVGSLLSVLLFTGCNSGDGASNTNTFDLTAMDTKSMTLHVEGTLQEPGNSAEINVTGFIAQTYLGTEELDGNQTHKQRINVELNQSNGVTTKIETTEFYSQGIMLKNINTDDNVTCSLANDPSPLPADATVGYESNPIEITCNDGDTATIVIRLEADGCTNGNVHVSEEGTENGRVYSETRDWIITPGMEFVSYQDHVQYEDGTVLQLNSTSIDP